MARHEAPEAVIVQGAAYVPHRRNAKHRRHGKGDVVIVRPSPSESVRTMLVIGRQVREIPNPEPGTEQIQDLLVLQDYFDAWDNRIYYANDESVSLVRPDSDFNPEVGTTN